MPPRGKTWTAYEHLILREVFTDHPDWTRADQAAEFNRRAGSAPPRTVAACYVRASSLGLLGKGRARGGPKRSPTESVHWRRDGSDFGTDSGLAQTGKRRQVVGNVDYQLRPQAPVDYAEDGAATDGAAQPRNNPARPLPGQPGVLVAPAPAPLVPAAAAGALAVAHPLPLAPGVSREAMDGLLAQKEEAIRRKIEWRKAAADDYNALIETCEARIRYGQQQPAGQAGQAVE